MTIRYTGRWGMGWHRSINVTGLQISVSYRSAELPTPEMLQIDIGGDATAEMPHPNITGTFWGGNDFDMGSAVKFSSFTPVSFPSDAVKVTTPSVAAMVFSREGLQDLNFVNVSMKWDLGRKDKLPGKFWKPPNPGKWDAMSLATGVGTVTAFGDLASDALPIRPLVRKKVSNEKRPWRAEVYPFLLGQSLPLPPNLPTEFNRIISALITTRDEFNRINSALRDASLDPDADFHVHFNVDGWASRMWRGTKNNAMRKELNQALSGERAKVAATALEAALAAKGLHVVEQTANGRGPGVFVLGDRGQPSGMLTDPEAEAEYIAALGRYQTWLQETYPPPTEREKRAMLDMEVTPYSPGADLPNSRRAQATVWFDTVTWEAEVETQSRADQMPGDPPFEEPQRGDDVEPKDAGVPGGAPQAQTDAGTGQKQPDEDAGAS
jgi:hypothetical protein